MFIPHSRNAAFLIKGGVTSSCQLVTLISSAAMWFKTPTVHKWPWFICFRMFTWLNWHLTCVCAASFDILACVSVHLQATLLCRAACTPVPTCHWATWILPRSPSTLCTTHTKVSHCHNQNSACFSARAPLSCGYLHDEWSTFGWSCSFTRRSVQNVQENTECLLLLLHLALL